jgi:hypothetical protein
MPSAELHQQVEHQGAQHDGDQFRPVVEQPLGDVGQRERILEPDDFFLGRGGFGGQIRRHFAQQIRP